MGVPFDLDLESAQAAAEIDSLIVGMPYTNSAVQKIADRLGVMKERMEVFDSSVVMFLVDLMKIVGRRVPMDVSGLASEIDEIISSLRNVGSRGPINAEAMRDFCLKLSNHALCERQREAHERRGCWG